MEDWADRADDPREWRRAVIATTEQDPKSLLPYQRGQVAHVVRSVPGARLLADAQHPTHPEWVVAPFLNEAWPRERIYRTASSVEAWINLLDDTGASFPVVYAAVKRFLAPVETDRYPFYQFTRKVGEEEPITARFPEETLDLLDAVTPKVLNRSPYELPKILELVQESEPALRSDHRHLRLIDLVDQS